MDHLGIASLFCVTGGGLGGCRRSSGRYRIGPRRNAIVLASTARVSPQTIALNEVARAIWRIELAPRGYYGGPSRPIGAGGGADDRPYLLPVRDVDAREIGRRLQERAKYGYHFATDFASRAITLIAANRSLALRRELLSHHQGDRLLRLGRGLPSLARLSDGRPRWSATSSDWLFPPSQSRELVRAMLKRDVDAAYVEIQSNYGHDAFLIETDRLASLTRDFLSAHRARQPAAAGAS